MIFEILGLLLLSQLLLGIYLWYQVRDLYKYPNCLGFPVIGNLYYFYKGYGGSSLDASYRYHKSLVEKHEGGIIFAFVNGRRAVGLSCPNLIEKIAYHPNISDKAPLYGALNGIMKGVFAYCCSDGEWKVRRKELNNCLTKNRIETQYYDQFLRITKNMIEKIEENTKKPDVDYNVTSFARNVFEATFCGIKNPTPLCRATFTTYTTHMSKVFISFSLACPMLGFVLLHIAGIFYRLVLPKSDNFRKEVFPALEQELNNKEKSSTKEDTHLPLVLLIGLRNNKRNLKERHFQLEFCELMVTASHTAMVTLTGALAYFAVLPEIQEKAWKEQYEIFGSDTRDSTVEDIKNMHYLDRFLKETLRFLAPPHIAKWTTGDINLDGVVIPAGTIVGILLHKMRMDPQYWKNPEVFDPERFLEEDSRPKYSYAPFGVGIRSCPGMLYAKYEIKVALSAILRRFKLTSTQKFEDLKYEMHLMTEISNLLPYKFEERI